MLTSHNELAQRLRRLLPALVLSVCAMAAPFGVQAQINPEIANCRELRDEPITPIAALCTAHTGCGYILNAQRSCASAKGYLERLQAAIGEGTRGLFGLRKEITPEAVFAAVLGGQTFSGARKLETLPDARQRIQEIDEQVRAVGAGDRVTVAEVRAVDPNNKAVATGPVVYYGQVKDGRARGAGASFYPDGKIARVIRIQERSRFDSLLPNGTRTVEELGEGGALWTASVSENGSMSIGTWNMGVYEGKRFRADGSVSEEGKFVEGGTLSVGTKQDAAGNRTKVNLPAAREAAAREAAEKARLAAEAENQRKRLAARKQEVAQANQERRPVVSPNLNALIEQIKGTKP